MTNEIQDALPVIALLAIKGLIWLVVNYVAGGAFLKFVSYVLMIGFFVAASVVAVLAVL